MLERFLLIWLLLSSGVAYLYPELLATTKPALPWLIAATMFSIGLMLPRDEIRQVFRRWPTVFGGTALQYAVMPLLAFGMGKAFGLTGDAFIGIVVVGCVPGAMASNVLTLNARGNTSYSISLTTTATLLSPIAVPLVLALALRSNDGVDATVLWSASQTLIVTVVVPVFIGHLLSRKYPTFEKHGQRYGALVANLAILWIIAIVVAISKSHLPSIDWDITDEGLIANFVAISKLQLEQLPLDLFGALLTVNLLGYAAGYVGGWGMRLPEPMRRALTLEVGMQNAGLGAALAVTLFPDQAGVAIAPAMYTFGCMLTGTILAHIWAGRSGPDKTTDEQPARRQKTLRQE